MFIIFICQGGCLDTDKLTEIIIGAAIEVHRELGPGLLESTYQACLVYELEQRGLGSECQKGVGITYKGIRIDCGYRMDLLVANTIIVELKSVESIDPIHVAQMITYLKLSGHQIGLLLNFNVTLLKDGIRRVVLGYSQKTPRPPRALR